MLVVVRCVLWLHFPIESHDGYPGWQKHRGRGERENERKDSTNVKNKPTPNERNKRERTLPI